MKFIDIFRSKRPLAVPAPTAERTSDATAETVQVDDATRLANLFGSDKGNQHHGKHFYTRVYSEYFDPIRQQNLKILEVGLLHINDPGWDDPNKRNAGNAVGRRAPSMEMWAQYFPNSTIIGFDINDFSDVRIDRTTIVRGDMGRREDLEQLIKLGPFDIIIDDASHASHHQQISLGFLFPHLVSGGTYWIEDLNYQPPDVEVEAATKTKKVLNNFECNKKITSNFIPPDESSYLEKYIASVEFFDSLQVGARKSRDNLVVLTKI